LINWLCTNIRTVWPDRLQVVGEVLATIGRPVRGAELLFRMGGPPVAVPVVVAQPGNGLGIAGSGCVLSAGSPLDLPDLPYEVQLFMVGCVQQVAVGRQVDVRLVRLVVWIASGALGTRSGTEQVLSAGSVCLVVDGFEIALLLAECPLVAGNDEAHGRVDRCTGRWLPSLIKGIACNVPLTRLIADVGSRAIGVAREAVGATRCFIDLGRNLPFAALLIFFSGYPVHG
jgi:hypothetical protein